MKSVITSFFIILIFLILIGEILPVMAGEELNITFDGNNTVVSEKNTTISSENKTDIRNFPEEEILPENISVVTGKMSKTTMIFAEGNSTSSVDTVNKSLISNNDTMDQISNNSTLALSKYESLGDIIKAKDWKALGEYNCKVKAENPDKFDDSIPTLADLQSKWNSRFSSPTTMVYTPCCG